MNGRSDEHFALDDFDAWMADQLAILPVFSPSPVFADRVMASIAVPALAAVHAPGPVRRRLFATGRSIAVTALAAFVVLGSMAGSVVWTMSHRDVLSTAGAWLAAAGGEWLWAGVQTVVANVIQQTWYGPMRDALAAPGRVAIVSALAALTYLSGVLALRKLMAAPSGPVSHASA